MVEAPNASAPPGIATLPTTTARQLSSGQVLVDPSSVVKELIDNALDSRAKSIFVDIATNTIDSIQVKDDGHGIASDDRVLVCRRYCTSKIRDAQDPKEIDGKWLGSRGEALSSAAEMSGICTVITRVEGEPVAVNLTYGRDGELILSKHASHPIGTTVKVTRFFDFIPVRKQTAIKCATKCLAKIRRLMQAYALARPAVRFRLHVLKAKDNRGDFVYVPQAKSNVEDAVLKVIGKECALQCDWTAVESDRYKIHAFLPKPIAIGAKIADYGAFISVDARPVSSSRGTFKQIVTYFRERLRKSNPALGSVKEPFFCMNIICPPDSYDPNIEPAKDDVIFENSDAVLDAVNKLLKTYYPKAALDREDENEPPESAQRPPTPQAEILLTRSQTPLPVCEDTLTELDKNTASQWKHASPRWRSSMYGMDEDDLEFLQQTPPLVLEQEDGLRAADISNPWTIAKMNIVTKPKQPITNGQLPSPVKSHIGGSMLPSSPAPIVTPRQPSPVELLTPQTSSRMISPRTALGDELESSIQRVAPGSTLQDTPFPNLSPLRLSQRKQRPCNNKSFAPPMQNSDDIWIGLPMRGSQSTHIPRRQIRDKHQEVPLFASDIVSNPERPDLGVAGRLVATRLHSANNADIRDFMRPNRGSEISDSGGSAPYSSFRPINAQAQPRHLDSQSSLVASGGERSSLHSIERSTPFSVGSRALSAEPQPRSKYVRDQLLMNANNGTDRTPRNMVEQFRAYAEREGPPRASSAGSSVSMLFNTKPTARRDAPEIRGNNVAGPEPQDIARQFHAYESNISQSATPVLSSLGNQRPPVLTQRSSQVAKSLNRYRQDKVTNTSHDISAYFRACEDREGPSAIQPTPPPHRREPRIAPSHKTTSKTSKLRRRTADGVERTKSSQLPLNHIPHGYHVHDIVLILATNTLAIVQGLRKLDMTRNSVDWRYASEDAYDVFAELVAENKVQEWAFKLDVMLSVQFERKGRGDARCELFEGTQRGLDARKGDDQVVEMIGDGLKIPVLHSEHGSDDMVAAKMDGNITTSLIETAVSDGTKSPVDEFSDFDMSEFVDLDADVPMTKVGETDDEPAEKVEDEFGDDIEDDMLMGCDG